MSFVDVGEPGTRSDIQDERREVRSDSMDSSGVSK